MNSTFDALLFNTKLVTGALLLLNFLLLTSLYFAVKWARAPRKQVNKLERHQEFTIFGMLAAVIALNGVAVYGNNALRSSTESLISELSGAPASGSVHVASSENLPMEQTAKTTPVVASRADSPDGNN
ncbi:MAG: hypothetical protein AAGJ79_10950 [Verrucomicrobiota bacterium]